MADVPPTEIITGLIRADTASRFAISQGEARLGCRPASPSRLLAEPCSLKVRVTYPATPCRASLPRRRCDGDAAHGGAPHAVRQRDRHPGCGRARGSHRWGLVLGRLMQSLFACPPPCLPACSSNLCLHCGVKLSTPRPAVPALQMRTSLRRWRCSACLRTGPSTCWPQTRTASLAAQPRWVWGDGSWLKLWGLLEGFVLLVLVSHPQQV